MKPRYFLLICIFILCWGVISCNSNKGSELNEKISTTQQLSISSTLDTVQNSQCISPLSKFSYITSVEHEKPTPRLNINLLPKDNWEIETSLPDYDKKDAPYIALITNSENQVTIWIDKGRSVSYEDMQDKSNFDYLVYDPTTKQWSSITGITDNPNIIVRNLFQTKDGSIWGQNISRDPFGEKEYPILNRFNPDIKQFEIVNNTAQIPLGMISGGNVLWDEILLDKNDTFWMIVNGDGIYSFSSKSQEINKHANIEKENITYSAISNEGLIYYLNYPYSSREVSDLELYQFSTVTQEIKRISIQLESSQMGSGLLFDQENRLWYSALGWMDTTKNWHQLFPSPEFLTNYIESGMQSRWRLPEILLQSSNEWYWFRSDNGMVYLDLENEKWCWFTTEQAVIKEDPQKNLWMVVDNHLYKYDLDQ